MLQLKKTRYNYYNMHCICIKKRKKVQKAQIYSVSSVVMVSLSLSLSLSLPLPLCFPPPLSLSLSHSFIDRGGSHLNTHLTLMSITMRGVAMNGHCRFCCRPTVCFSNWIMLTPNMSWSIFVFMHITARGCKRQLAKLKT